jgi:ubiquinone/menaquinone biosynthesis C-methylase UbiE
MTNDFRRPRYLNFPEARRAYARGENVTLHLQRQLGVRGNTSDIIEIAYDLQAGTYIAHAKDHRTKLESYAAEMAGVLAPYVDPEAAILDVGCGELTTLTHMVNSLDVHRGPLTAFDISWSRLYVGRSYASSNMKREAYMQLRLFTAEMSEIPLPDKSIDVVISSHALEPNHGREKELLGEILRVARRHVILFEPSYELNSAKGRARMETLGYVRGLQATAIELGAKVVCVTPLANIANPLNPTAAFVLEPPSNSTGTANNLVFCDPGSSSNLIKRENYLFSPERGVSYPIIEGIPILRSSAAVLTSALSTEVVG